MNETQEELLAWCHRTFLLFHPFYCLYARFGNKCFDCSGFVFKAYQHIGVAVGLDTGGLYAQARANKWITSVRQCSPGDIMLHIRSGRNYNGGPDEHTGIFVRYDGIYMWTWESAGSGNGVNLYRRPITFWQDAISVPAVRKGGTPPIEVKIVQEDEMFRVIHGDSKGPEGRTLWFTNWLEKRKIDSPDEANAIIRAGTTNGAGTLRWPQAWVDNIPVQKDSAEELKDTAALIEAVKR